MDVALAWSGGKDAAAALWTLADDDAATVTELFTTTAADTDRTTMHGVRPELIERQAEAVGLPLHLVELPADPTNEAYEDRMHEAHEAMVARGVDAVAFADLALEDVRAYREERLADTALDGYWPVWGRDTDEFARAFLDAGFRALVVCVDDVGASFAGREYDADLLAALPDGVDPCGENGEFHTFVYDGPPFDAPVAVERGERVTRELADGSVFHYCDLLPA